jgi:anti-anti-sigma factor
MHADVARRVETRLDRGERWLVLDLRTVSEIDAAGVGELVRAFNRTRAAGAVLQIASASRRVQTLLDVTCVSKLLPAFSETERPRHNREAGSAAGGGC